MIRNEHEHGMGPVDLKYNVQIFDGIPSQVLTTSSWSYFNYNPLQLSHSTRIDTEKTTLRTSDDELKANYEEVKKEIGSNLHLLIFKTLADILIKCISNDMVH